MKGPSILLLLACAALVSPAAGAADAPAAPPPDDPIAQHLFPPELIMKHSAEINLEPQQRAEIKEAVLQAQTRFLDAQWELQGETAKMVHLLQARLVDEKAVLAEADRVMDLERQIKKTQLSLLIRLKNLLTPAQQSRLAALRKSAE